MLAKVRIVKAMVFPVIMYGCESWTIKKAECQRNDSFKLWCWRRLLRVPLTARRSNQSILKNQPWIFTGRTDAKAETPILWPPDAKGWLIEKDPDVVQDWGQEEKGVTEDQVVGWHHWLNGHEFEETIIPEIVNDREEAWYAVVLWVTKSWIWQLTEQQQLKDYVCNICLQWYAEHC